MRNGFDLKRMCSKVETKWPHMLDFWMRENLWKKSAKTNNDSASVGGAHILSNFITLLNNFPIPLTGSVEWQCGFCQW